MVYLRQLQTLFILRLSVWSWPQPCDLKMCGWNSVISWRRASYHNSFERGYSWLLYAPKIYQNMFIITKKRSYSEAYFHSPHKKEYSTVCVNRIGHRKWNTRRNGLPKLVQPTVPSIPYLVCNPIRSHSTRICYSVLCQTIICYIINCETAKPKDT